MTAPHKPSVVDRTGFLRVVAIYKFAQTAVLVLLGLAAMRLVRPDVAAAFEQWVRDLPGGHVQRVSERFLDWVLGPETNRALLLGLALFAYAALFLVEAVGMWMQKRWAEWLTVIATATLIPPEIYECITHPSVMVFVLLLLNVCVVWLLATRLRHELALDAQLRAKRASEGTGARDTA
jgi:uncharacterized membrane protein (DUF2068 family)